MTEPSNERDELHRLREENLRLREERLAANQGGSDRPETPVINIKQVNEGCASGCGGILAIAIIAGVLVTQCSG